MPGQILTDPRGTFGNTVRPTRQVDSFKTSAAVAAKAVVAIAVDGAITPDTAPQVCSAGASILISGSYIMNSEDVGVALRALQSD